MHRTQHIRHYQQSSVDSVAATATPHQLIAMLLEGALDRIARARGAAHNGDGAGRMRNVGSAISIIEYLSLSLNLELGPISDRLAALYDFCVRRLAQANASGDARMLDEVAEVLRPIKLAWEELPRSQRVQ